MDEENMERLVTKAFKIEVTICAKMQAGRWRRQLNFAFFSSYRAFLVSVRELL
jgi:hypothetical protein